MANDLEFRKLVERARAHEEEALALIYEQYVDRVYRYVLLRVRNREVAEDIAGQTFLKMVERIGGFKWRGGGFGAWLFRIAHNNVVDWYRRRPDAEELDPQMAATEAGPEAATLAGEALCEALETVKGLKENQRDVVLLRIVAEMTTRETAVILEISEANVRTLLHRALGNIQEQLQEQAHV